MRVKTLPIAKKEWYLHAKRVVVVVGGVGVVVGVVGVGVVVVFFHQTRNGHQWQRVIDDTLFYTYSVDDKYKVNNDAP